MTAAEYHVEERTQTCQVLVVTRVPDGFDDPLDWVNDELVERIPDGFDVVEFPDGSSVTVLRRPETGGAYASLGAAR